MNWVEICQHVLPFNHFENHIVVDHDPQTLGVDMGRLFDEHGVHVTFPSQSFDEFFGSPLTQIYGSVVGILRLLTSEPGLDIEARNCNISVQACKPSNNDQRYIPGFDIVVDGAW